VVGKKIAVAVPEVGEGLFEGDVVVDAFLDELQPLFGFSQDFGPCAHSDPDTGVLVLGGFAVQALGLVGLAKSWHQPVLD
jgi:hypothetical protein